MDNFDSISLLNIMLINKRKLFSQLVSDCSIPVIVKQTNDEAYGGYYSKRNYPSNCRIEINSLDNIAHDIVSLLHEQVHYRHENENCRCMNRSCRTLAEYHAYKEGLQAAIKLGNKDIIKETILLIQGQAEKNFTNSHRTAAKKVMRLKLWQKALKWLDT